MDKDGLFISSFNKMFEVRRTLSKLKKKESLPDYHFSELKCIELIDEMEDANVTKLSEVFYMTRGGVSKIVKKLLAYGAIESYRKPENKKEIYFKLTYKGKAINEKYNEIAAARNDIDRAFFSALDEDEKNVVIRFLDKYNQHLEYHINKENEPKDENI